MSEERDLLPKLHAGCEYSCLVLQLMFYMNIIGIQAVSKMVLGSVCKVTYGNSPNTIH